MSVKRIPSHLCDSDLCEKAQAQGHGGEAERALYDRYALMCQSEARDFTPKGGDIGEMKSAALQAFGRAIFRFEPDKNVTFRHYAKRVVRNALLDQLRQDRRDAARRTPYGLEDPLPSGDGGTISDLIEDPSARSYAETAPLRDVLGRYASLVARAYAWAAQGPEGGAPEPLRAALASSARALLDSGVLADGWEMESFIVALGAKNGQLLLGERDDDAAERAARDLARAHLAAAVRAAEGDETLKQATAGLAPESAIAALRLVAELSLPISDDA